MNAAIATGTDHRGLFVQVNVRDDPGHRIVVVALISSRNRLLRDLQRNARKLVRACMVGVGDGSG